MPELKIEDKEKYLNENYPFDPIPDLLDKKECIHCGNLIIVGNYKVYRAENGFEYICCPNAPECNGTVIDWIDV